MLKPKFMIMKTVNRFVILLLFMAILSSCNKESGVDPIVDPELPSTNILVDDGYVGLVIDARAIARKGYHPAIADVSFSGSSASFSQKIDIHPNTSAATVRIPSKDLSEDVINQLSDGVGATIQILNELSEVLATYTDNVKVDDSNKPLVVDTDLPVIYPELVIDENTPYFIQAITDDPDASNKLFGIRIDNSFEPGLDAITLKAFNPSQPDEFSFYFEAINDTVYHIKMELNNSGNPFYLRMSGPGNFYSYYDTNPAAVDQDIYKFIVNRDEKGLIKIQPLSGNPLGKRITSYDTQVSYASSADNYLPVRMVAANITWSVEDRGTDFNDPILPPAKLDFAYKSILKNCSPAVLTETVGKSESQTKSYTVGTEESLELYSSHEARVDVTAGVETEVTLFGQSATASLEVSAGYTYTTSKTETTTNTWEETVEETIEISRVRDVEIPEFTAVEVFDAIQSIDNVQMPFVQIIRVRGLYDGSDPMTGEDISSQLLANQFGGVVTSIESDYVEISIRGTATINKFFETESQVNEIQGECDN
jgi:hypothetical protein